MDTISKEPRRTSASNPVSVVKTAKTPLARMYEVTKLGRRGRSMQRLAKHGGRDNRSRAG